MSSLATLSTDGGARGNPGPAGIGYVLSVPGRKVITAGEYIGEATNNQAEYQALQTGLERALAEGVTQLTCYLDSELVVRQLAGEYRVKESTLRIYFTKVDALRKKFSRITFTHVRREKNELADTLVNQAIDQAQKAKMGYKPDSV